MSRKQDGKNPGNVSAGEPGEKTPEQQREAISILIKEGLLGDVLPEPADPVPENEEEEPSIAIQFLMSLGMTREEAEQWHDIT